MLVFTVDGANVTAAEPTTFFASGLQEKHVKNWTVTHPAIIGPDVMVVATEVRLRIDGRRHLRIDILALDRIGRLVIVELKRDRARRSAVTQATEYVAAATSRLSAWSLAEEHARFLGGTVTQAEALASLAAFTNGRLTASDLPPPRIVVIAGEVDAADVEQAKLLQTLDITLQRCRLFRGDGGALTATFEVVHRTDAHHPRR